MEADVKTAAAKDAGAQLLQSQLIKYALLVSKFAGDLMEILIKLLCSILFC